MNEIKNLAMKWTGEASQFIGDLFDYSRPYLEGTEGGLEEPVRFISSQLFIDCHLSSESVLILVSNLKEWDAELINRAIIEGTVKYIYLMDGEPDDRIRKANEYWNLMPDYMSIKRSERAKAFLQEIGNPDSEKWIPIKELVISDNEVEARRHGTNRQQRMNLERDWSFSGIVQRYSHSDKPDLRLLKHLAHGYGISSHLIHKDGDGIGMVWERYRREPQRQAVVKLAHFARLVSDICAFAKFRAACLLSVCKLDHTPIHEIEVCYKSLFESLRTAGTHFNETEYEDDQKN